MIMMMRQHQEQLQQGNNKRNRDENENRDNDSWKRVRTVSLEKSDENESENSNSTDNNKTANENRLALLSSVVATMMAEEEQEPSKSKSIMNPLIQPQQLQPLVNPQHPPLQPLRNVLSTTADGSSSSSSSDDDDDSSTSTTTNNTTTMITVHDRIYYRTYEIDLQQQHSNATNNATESSSNDDDHRFPLPIRPRLPTIQESEHLIALSSGSNDNNNTNDFHRVVDSFNYNVVDDDDSNDDDCDDDCDDNITKKTFHTIETINTNIVGDDNTATGQATTTTPKKKRRQQYSNETKIQVKLALETRPDSLDEIASEFDIAAGTVRGWQPEAKKMEWKEKRRKEKKRKIEEEKKNPKKRKLDKTKQALREEKERTKAEEAAERKVHWEEREALRREECQRLIVKGRALQEEKKRWIAKEAAKRARNPFMFDDQKPTKPSTTELLNDVEYSKRDLRPYICGGYVFTPSVGVCTDNLVVALIKEIIFLLDQKLLQTEDVVSALWIRRSAKDGAYIQLNLKGSGADKILQNFKKTAPIICSLIDKWNNNPDTSTGDKMLIYPPGGSTTVHNDGEKIQRINLHFGIDKSFMLVKKEHPLTLYEDLTCKPNCEYHIYGGSGDMFCDSTICKHKGMMKGKSAGFTIVTNPPSEKAALERPAFLSEIFLELNTLVDDLKCQSQSVEENSRLLKEKFCTMKAGSRVINIPQLTIF